MPVEWTGSVFNQQQDASEVQKVTVLTVLKATDRF